MESGEATEGYFAPERSPIEDAVEKYFAPKRVFIERKIEDIGTRKQELISGIRKRTQRLGIDEYVDPFGDSETTILSRRMDCILKEKINQLEDLASLQRDANAIPLSTPKMLLEMKDRALRTYMEITESLPLCHPAAAYRAHVSYALQQKEILERRIHTR